MVIRIKKDDVLAHAVLRIVNQTVDQRFQVREIAVVFSRGGTAISILKQQLPRILQRL